MTFRPDFSLGNYVPEQIELPLDQDQLREELKKILEEHARTLNRKDTGQYEEVEIQNNQTFPGATQQTRRYVYRKILIFGAIAPGATLNLPHGITGITDFTRIYGTIITSVPDNRPLPYVDTALVTNQVSVLRNGINIVITNGATAPNITSGRVILEFYKN